MNDRARLARRWLLGLAALVAVVALAVGVLIGWGMR